MYYEDQRSLTTVVKNLLLINIIVFVGCWLDNSYFMTKTFALWAPDSPYFHFWQPVTYMFMHANFWHIFFNMYTLFIFGMVTERIIGSRKFFILYMVCGLVAAGLHLGVDAFAGGPGYPTVGASGAIYGVLIAYAMLFPESRMMLLFPPVVLKAKWLALIFIGIELFSGVVGTSDGIAHFAHLGGALAGWLLILFWKHTGRLFDRY